MYSDSLAATNCEQSFTFLGKSPGSGKSESGSPVFWIVEDINGECHRTHLIQITVSDHGPLVASSGAKKYMDWAWLRDGIGHLRMETPVELEAHEGVWRCPGAS